MERAPDYYPIQSRQTGFWHVNCAGIRQPGRWDTQAEAQREADRLNRNHPSAFITARNPVR